MSQNEISLSFSPISGTSEEHEKYEECPFISEPNKSAAFLPFGSGARACVGQKFAIHGISTLLASLLQNYEVGDLHYVCQILLRLTLMLHLKMA